MSRETKINLLIIFISILVALWAFKVMLPTSPVQLEKDRKEQARIFCAHGRQWIEFQNGNMTWGAMMNDIDGKPIICNSVTDQKIVKG